MVQLFLSLGIHIETLYQNNGSNDIITDKQPAHCDITMGIPPCHCDVTITYNNQGWYQMQTMSRGSYKQYYFMWYHPILQVTCTLTWHNILHVKPERIWIYVLAKSETKLKTHERKYYAVLWPVLNGISITKYPVEIPFRALLFVGIK